MEKTITLKSQPWSTELGAKSELLKIVTTLPKIPNGLGLKLSTSPTNIDTYSPCIEQTRGEETTDGGFLEGLATLIFISPKGYRALDTLTLRGKETLIEDYIQMIKS